MGNNLGLILGIQMNLNEKIVTQPILEEMSSEKLPDGVLCRISYPICDIGQKNANDRVYEADVWEGVHAKKDLQDKLEHRALFGHAEHPEQTQSNLEKTSHVIFEMWTKDGQEWQKFDVMDTPTGRIVDCLLRGGCRVGCSTRASGDLEEAEDSDGNSYNRVVAETYDYVTTDFTADPSTSGSIPYNVKRNIVTEVKKLFENKEADEGEKNFGVGVLESMSCKDKGKCQKCGGCKVLEERKLSGEKKTVESLIKDGTIKEGTPVLLQYAQDNIKEGKVKIKEGAVSVLVGVGRPVAVNVDGDATVSISPEGVIAILPTEVMEPQEAMVEPEVTEVPEQAPEELSPCPDEGEAPPEVEPGMGDAIIIGDVPEKCKKPGNKSNKESIKVGATIKIEEGEHKDKEGKVTKIDETGITISLDDGTQVNIEDPTAVNITVTKPLPAEEIELVGSPPEEEIDDMAAAGPLPITNSEKEFESKANEQKLSVDNVKKLFKSIDAAFAKHLTGLYGTEKQVALKGKEVGLVLSAEGKKVLESKVEESEELATGNLLRDKEGEEWVVKDAGDAGLTIYHPGEPGSEQLIAWEDVEGLDFTKLSEAIKEDCSRKEFLTRQVKKLQKQKADFEKGNQRKLNQVEKELKALKAEGSGIKEEKESFEEWYQSNAIESDAAVLNDYSIYYEQCKSDNTFPLRFKEWALEEFEEEYSERSVDEVKVEEATSVQKEDGWYVESPSGAILGGPYKSKIIADKRKKDVEFYSSSKESKVAETLDKDGSLHILFKDLTPQAGDEVKAYFEKDALWPDFVVAIANPPEGLHNTGESISTTVKEIKGLRVEEAATRAERDKAIELIAEISDEKTQLEETSRKEKAFEAKILINKIEKTLEAKERELDAVRAKLEEKAKLANDLNGQLKEQKNLVAQAEEQWGDVVVAATNRVNAMKETATVTKDKHRKNLSEADDGYQKKLDVLVKINEVELEKVKKEITEKVRKEFVECFVGFKLSETNLVVDDNSRALLEKCKSLTAVEELLEKIVDASRRGALHSKPITSVYISEAKGDPELDEAERRVGDAYRGMNSTG